MSTLIGEYVWDLHNAGVHVECTPADNWTSTKKVGDGTPRKCVLAGKLERFHSHDFDGPLVCGCDDDA